jgi:CRP-like cAMP-binding protein
MLLCPPRAKWLAQIPMREKLRFAGDALIETNPKMVNVVLDGIVRVCLLSGDGRERVLWYLPKGSLFGEQAALGGASMRADVFAIADGPCQIGRILAEDILSEIRTNQELFLDIMRVTTQKTSLLVQELERAVFASARVQIACLLSTLGQNTCCVSMSQERLAHITGKTRVTVAAQLHHLEALGAIRLERSRILIIAPALLAELARSGGEAMSTPARTDAPSLQAVRAR